ncbi:hypothetical protein AYO21_00317 [Fonsecaea monophora]|uniref:Uncharacterized protein n=1 Tax=Fonsecaea monophora TaxID=254056 RepID=A0A177FPJ4_9EURO|nr:hypothetical protein AYO21_00317 [Fonsecaea monophora]KAH0832783.1 hypothetical protein FOPE_01322 [Fonsecaea pedrosoi]OAG45681.1 hypothetical protein AYO21_00317 [Fonsecaea monophora]
MSNVTSSSPPQQRPSLYRSQSHANSSNKNDPSSSNQPQSAEPSARPSRPSHGRSKSYLSPADPKPRNAITLPTATSAFEKTASRLHLPGTSHRHHHQKDKDHNSSGHQHSQSHSHISHHNNDSTHSLTFRRHRPTQSEAHPIRRFASKEALSTLPHLVAGLNAERDKRIHTGNVPNPINPTNRSAGSNGVNSTGAHFFGPSAAISSDFQAGGRYDYNASGFPELRRRATSDPASRDKISQPAPAHPLRPKTSFEEALDRGDAARVARRIHVKVEDLQRRDTELRAGEEELRSRVAEITATGVEITRRLDYGYYNLLEKVGSLVSMIGSFQSLARQTETLIRNFERESKRVDEDTRRRVKTLQGGFEARQVKAKQLSERGDKVSARARELSARLEKARAKVEEWENREEKFRKAWDRVWGIVWWTSIAVLVIVLAVVLGKEWYFHGDPVKAGLGQHGEGNWNRSLRLGGTAGGQENERLLRLSEGGDGSAPSDPSSNENDTASGEKRLNVPDDVREILLGIAERNYRRKKAFPEVPSLVFGTPRLTTNSEEDQCREDPRLARLDEL